MTLFYDEDMKLIATRISTTHTLDWMVSVVNVTPTAGFRQWRFSYFVVRWHSSLLYPCIVCALQKRHCGQHEDSVHVHLPGDNVDQVVGHVAVTGAAGDLQHNMTEHDRMTCDM